MKILDFLQSQGIGSLIFVIQMTKYLKNVILISRRKLGKIYLGIFHLNSKKHFTDEMIIKNRCRLMLLTKTKE